MKEEAKKRKKEYVKPAVTRVKLVIEEPVLGNCYSIDTFVANAASCQSVSCAPG